MESMKFGENTKIQSNNSYLFLEKTPAKSFKVFKELLRKEYIEGLVVSVTNPANLTKKYNLKEISKKVKFIWLVARETKNLGFNQILLAKLEIFRKELIDYINSGKDKVILLHGIELLFNYRKEREVLLVLHQLSDAISTSDNLILIIPFEQNSVDERTFARLSKKFELIY